MGKLNNKTALITGGTTGIGFATAKAYLKAGARLAITGQNTERLAQAGKALGEDVLVLSTDQTDLRQLDAMVQELTGHFSTLDTVFLNAGVTLPAPIVSVTEDQFDVLYRTNLKGPFFTLQKIDTRAVRGRNDCHKCLQSGRHGRAHNQCIFSHQSGACFAYADMCGRASAQGHSCQCGGSRSD